jgi:hypothetical protein
MPREPHRRSEALGLSLIVLLGQPYALPAAAGERPRAAAALPLEAGDLRVVDAARQGAMARLRTPECRKLLEDFRDGEGHLLEQKLAAFAAAPDEFLAALPMLDGSSRPLCLASRSYLLTTCGVPRVFVCRSYLRAVYQERTMAEVYLIHELLHTLGLGENPPSSQEITRQVVRRCAP